MEGRWAEKLLEIKHSNADMNCTAKLIETVKSTGLGHLYSAECFRIEALVPVTGLHMYLLLLSIFLLTFFLNYIFNDYC